MLTTAELRRPHRLDAEKPDQREYDTNCYTSQHAPENVPSRPAAPEMVPRPAAVGEVPSPDGRVLSDLASICLAYGAVVSLRSKS